MEIEKNVKGMYQNHFDLNQGDFSLSAQLLVTKHAHLFRPVCVSSTSTVLTCGLYCNLAERILFTVQVCASLESYTVLNSELSISCIGCQRQLESLVCYLTHRREIHTKKNECNELNQKHCSPIYCSGPLNIYTSIFFINRY